MLCPGFNVVGFNWISSPAATELESIVLDWMGKLLKLPSSFLFSGTGGGVLHGSTCEATATKLVGIPPSNFRFIETSFSTGFSMSTEQVRLAIEHDIKSGLVPLFLCATIGTTACGAIDPIAELGKVARKYKLWLHIDAAYAGSACICPELRHCLDGVELANSISMNPHKCDISMAKRFAAFVAEDDRFEIVVPRKFVLVASGLSPSKSLKAQN
ncbi:Tyrosine/DOPA decarboxylase, putative [Theobroma cacao]|uniref:Tyrosine/DOPA decarboxylase, putative n=1 Tax=Theobroma cacao TaxID=3641 RepID=A0A061F260_THECC|nr:Tyrosine/DOPA decarboxylase, putative [Theobroma cacao]